MKVYFFALYLAMASSGQAAALCLPGPQPSVGVVEAAASHAPAQAPQAMPVLHTEGTLPHQGVRDQSLGAKRDFDYMRDLALAWSMTRDRTALDRLAIYLDAWSGTYKLSFNPVDETNLDGLIDAYVLTHMDLPPPVAQRTQRFLKDMAEGYLQQMEDHRGDRTGRWINNWQSHRIKLAAMASAAIGDDQLLAKAQDAFLSQLNVNVGPDGEVLDFRERDALHYVVYDLEPLIRGALAAASRGQDWLGLAGSNGQSLRTALDWLTPYADGEKTHDEYVQTTVRFDIERRAAGEPGFSGLWKPKGAAGLYWSASLLDPRYLALAKKITVTPPRWLWAISCTPQR